MDTVYDIDPHFLLSNYERPAECRYQEVQLHGMTETCGTPKRILFKLADGSEWELRLKRNGPVLKQSRRARK